MNAKGRLTLLLDDPGFYEIQRRTRAGRDGYEEQWRLGMVVDERLTWWLGPSLEWVIKAVSESLGERESG